MAKNIEYAIEAVYRIREIGFIGQRTFLLTHEKDSVIEDYDPSIETPNDAIDRMATMMGQEYYRMWLGDDKTSIHTITDVDKLKAHISSNGVYYITINAKYSTHQFIWIVRNGHMTWVGNKLIDEYNITESIRLIQDYIRNELNPPNCICCLKREQTEGIGFLNMEIRKSTKYY